MLEAVARHPVVGGVKHRVVRRLEQLGHGIQANDRAQVHRQRAIAPGQTGERQYHQHAAQLHYGPGHQVAGVCPPPPRPRPPPAAPPPPWPSLPVRSRGWPPAPAVLQTAAPCPAGPTAGPHPAVSSGKRWSPRPYTAALQKTGRPARARWDPALLAPTGAAPTGPTPLRWQTADC